MPSSPGISETPIDNLLSISESEDRATVLAEKVRSAIWDCRLGDLRVLLGAGADPNLPIDGLTAVQRAAMHGSGGALQVLASTGKANFLVTTERGNLPSELVLIAGGNVAVSRWTRLRERNQLRLSAAVESNPAAVSPSRAPYPS